jgi:hypothetical protein
MCLSQVQSMPYQYPLYTNLTLYYTEVTTILNVKNNPSTKIWKRVHHSTYRKHTTQNEPAALFGAIEYGRHLPVDEQHFTKFCFALTPFGKDRSLLHVGNVGLVVLLRTVQVSQLVANATTR